LNIVTGILLKLASTLPFATMDLLVPSLRDASHLFLTDSFRCAPASVTAPFD
jgi:hypothetical protein